MHSLCPEAQFVEKSEIERLISIVGGGYEERRLLCVCTLLRFLFREREKKRKNRIKRKNGIIFAETSGGEINRRGSGTGIQMGLDGYARMAHLNGGFAYSFGKTLSIFSNFKKFLKILKITPNRPKLPKFRKKSTKNVAELFVYINRQKLTIIYKFNLLLFALR